MTDKELLMLAAKAADIKVKGFYEDEDTLAIKPGPGMPTARWNPLTNDGDALRLAVRCAQLFGFYRFLRAWLVAMATENGNPADPYAATRRAIVRAAAELGRSMA